MKITPLLSLLGINAVPAWGYFGEGWSPATTLAVYWSENVIGSAFIAARIALHRKVTRKRGHDTSQTPVSRKPGEKLPPRERRPWLFLTGFLTMSLTFSAVQGVFLGVILWMLRQKGAGPEMIVSFEDWRVGTLALTGFIALWFAIDLINLKEKPFAWLRQMSETALARIVLINMVIMIGVFAMVFFNQPRTLFAVFMAMKTMVQIGGLLPRYTPSPEPPRWMAKTIGRWGPKDHDFETYWRESYAEDRARWEDDERVRD